VTSAAAARRAVVAAKPADSFIAVWWAVGLRRPPKTGRHCGAFRFVLRAQPTLSLLDVDAAKSRNSTAALWGGVIVTWAVQSADGQRREKKSDYAASLFAKFGCK
jgi:hypothetical protein